jgi:hypothetical protein
MLTVLGIQSLSPRLRVLGEKLPTDRILMSRFLTVESVSAI